MGGEMSQHQDSSGYSGLGGWKRWQFAGNKRRRKGGVPRGAPLHLVVPIGYQKEAAGSERCDTCWYRARRSDNLLNCRALERVGVVETSGWCPGYARSRPR